MIEIYYMPGAMLITSNIEPKKKENKTKPTQMHLGMMVYEQPFTISKNYLN